MGKTAFVTGANGISGSAILEHLAKNTSREEWESIIVTSRSPFQTTVSDPRITFIALDYTEDVNSLVEKQQHVCKNVTHAYFCSYVHKSDFQELNAANANLFENFLDSLEQVAPRLENVSLQTGGKYYQLHLMPLESPVREDMDRIHVATDNFYFPQEDRLASSQLGKKWTWNVIRPVAVIGSTSKPNGMNLALNIAMYMLTCRELGVEAPMPTNQRYWEGTDDISCAPLVADLTVYASTHKNCANQAFNVTNGDYFTWKYMWPRLAAHFGVKATSNQVFTKPYPKEGNVQLENSFVEWSHGKQEVWNNLCERNNLPGAKSTWTFGIWALGDWVFQRTWSTTLSISKARKFGWTGYKDSYESFIETFETFKKHGLTPG